MSNTPSPYTPQIQSLLNPLASVSLSDATRATFRALCSDLDAHAEGNRIHSAAVLDELLRIASLSHPYVSAARVPGYGPMRLKYTLELGLTLAGLVHDHDDAMVNAAGAGASKTTNLKGSRALRRTALRVLKSLAGNDAAALARIESAASEGSEKPDERARSLNALAEELESVAANLSPEVAADMGVSQTLIADLRTNAKAVLGAREDARNTRGDIASHYDQMNLLDGRLLFELRALFRAMRDARKNDPTIPQVQAGRVQRSGKAAPPAAPAPADSKPEQP